MIPTPKRLHKNLVAPYGEGELPSSLCSRTAYMCGRTVTDFCLEMGTRFIDVVMGRKTAIKRIAEVCGIDPGQLLRDTPVRTDSRAFEWNGQRILVAGLRQYRPHVCIRCVEEDLASGSVPQFVRPYMRSLWTVVGIRTCEKHNVALTDVSAGKGGIRMCDLPTVLAARTPEFDELLANVREQPFSAFEKFVRDRLSGENTSGNWLGDVRVDAAVRTCEMVGAAAAEGAKAPFKRISEERRYQYAEHGFQLINRDPELTGLAGQLFSDCIKRGLYPTPFNVFGHLWRGYYVRSRDNGFEAMYNHLKRRAVELLPVGPGDDVFGEVTSPRKWHSPRTLKANFGLSKKQAVQLLMAYDQNSAWKDLKKNKHLLVDAAAVEKFIASTHIGLTTAEAMDYINARPYWAKLLMDRGLIKPLLYSDANIRRTYRFEKHVLDNFLNDVLQDAVSVPDECDGYETVNIVARRTKNSAADIFRLLADRKIPNVRRLQSARGCAAILVKFEDVVTILSRPEEGFTVPQLAKLLSVPQRSVSALIRNGLLRSSRKPSAVKNIVRFVVTEADLATFQQKHIGACELGKLMGLTTTSVGHKCARNKIRTAFQLPGLVSRFYLRSEIPWI